MTLGQAIDWLFKHPSRLIYQEGGYDRIIIRDGLLCSTWRGLYAPPRRLVLSKDMAKANWITGDDASKIHAEITKYNERKDLDERGLASMIDAINREFAAIPVNPPNKPSSAEGT
jgi:hypothetical protein